MAAEAKSSKGVRMWLSKGSAEGAVVHPTAISKSSPTEVTAAQPAPAPPEVIALLSITQGVTTGFTVSGADFAKLGDQVTFAGFLGDWVPLNGSHDITTGATGEFSVAIDSSGFTPPPTPSTVSATVAGADREFALDQIVYCDNTGFPELDGKYFTISEVMTSPSGFKLLGADTTDSRGQLMPGASMTVYSIGDLISMCLNNFAFALETPGTVAAGTYCNPSATLPATATGAGTATLGGWIDIDDAAYRELLRAEDDALKRVFVIQLPLNQGEIVAPLTVSGITWDIPLEGGMAFTATAALGARPRHLF